jgi:hypothetical protein
MRRGACRATGLLPPGMSRGGDAVQSVSTAVKRVDARSAGACQERPGCGKPGTGPPPPSQPQWPPAHPPRAAASPRRRGARGPACPPCRPPPPPSRAAPGRGGSARRSPGTGGGRRRRQKRARGRARRGRATATARPARGRVFLGGAEGWRGGGHVRRVAQQRSRGCRRRDGGARAALAGALWLGVTARAPPGPAGPAGSPGRPPAPSPPRRHRVPTARGPRRGGPSRPGVWLARAFGWDGLRVRASLGGLLWIAGRLAVCGMRKRRAATNVPPPFPRKQGGRNRPHLSRRRQRRGPQAQLHALAPPAPQALDVPQVRRGQSLTGLERGQGVVGGGVRGLADVDVSLAGLFWFVWCARAFRLV